MDIQAWKIPFDVACILKYRIIETGLFKNIYKLNWCNFLQWSLQEKSAAFGRQNRQIRTCIQKENKVQTDVLLQEV